jgi:hypothetical protein
VKKPPKPKVGKNKKKRPTPGKILNPGESPAPLHRRLWRGAKVAAAFFAAVVGVLGVGYEVWGPQWMTAPTFFPGSPSFGSPFDVPFIVTNKSALFRLSNLTISCEIRFKAEGPSGSVVEKVGDDFSKISARGVNKELKAAGTSWFTCPLRGIARVDGFDAADRITSAQVAFSSEYDSLLWGRSKARSDEFTLNTETTPPQWTAGSRLK